MVRWDSNLGQVDVEAHGISLRVYPGLGRGEVLERKRGIDIAAAFGSLSLVGREEGGPTEVSRGCLAQVRATRWASRRWWQLSSASGRDSYLCWTHISPELNDLKQQQSFVSGILLVWGSTRAWPAVLAGSFPCGCSQMPAGAETVGGWPGISS